MDPGQPDLFFLGDVVVSQAGRDRGEMFYVVGTDPEFLLLANGKNRTLEEPKRKKQKHVEKVLRSETRVAAKLLSGDKVLNGELRRDLAFIGREMQSNNPGGFELG